MEGVGKLFRGGVGSGDGWKGNKKVDLVRFFIKMIL
jgi:hypothetical protein